MKNKRLIEIIENYKNKKIAVIGDLMLDVYVWGNTNRISPEAPVPIVRVKEKTQCLGGASNVMRNIATLGGKVNAYGVMGDDDEAVVMRDLFAKYSINSQSVYNDKSRTTTVKKRIIASGQQLIRVDYEDTQEVSCELRNKITDDIIELIENKEIDAIIFEDYAKGLLSSEMLTKISQKAKEKDIVLALDPNPNTNLKMENFTLMTPNRSEAFALAGVHQTPPITPVEQDENLLQVAKSLIKKWNTKYLLITLGSQGMVLFDKNSCFTVIPTKAKEVFDVSGAGDTVIAAFTLALLGGATIEEAANFANNAAGIVVGKVGTVSVDAKELINLN